MNHSKKHSSIEEQQERHDSMIQRRSAGTVDDLPKVTRFPFDTPMRDSLGCEGGVHIDQKALNDLPQIPVFRAYAPAPSPTPAEPEKTAPAPDPAPRFGIWSDGTLALRVKAGFFELESDEFAALLAFVDRMRDGRAA